MISKEMGMHEYDVIVIGAGVLGSFHAYHAARKGYRVCLVERNSLPNDASTRNFGMIASSIVDVRSKWAGYARASIALYREVQRQVDISMRETGSLYLASTPLETAVLWEFVEVAPPEYVCVYYDGPEARSRYPFANPEYCNGALLFPEDLAVEPRRLLQQLIPYMVEQEGITYEPNTLVTSVEVAGDKCLVRDVRGKSRLAERVFVCTGAEYRTLFPERFIESGLVLCKLQMMQTIAQPLLLPHSLLSGLSIRRYPAFAVCPSYSLLMEEPIDPYILEMGIHLLIKQAADGAIVIGDSHEYSALQEAIALEERTNLQIQEAILHYGQSMITLPTWELQQLWNGFYLNYPQGPIFTETIDGAIHIATGIGGKGMTTGPGFALAHVEEVLG
jgi:FAD dependent oxidoreductase TIGR03364